MPRSYPLWILCFLAVSFLAVGRAHADDVVPPGTELPPTLSLDEALRIFRNRRLDLSIAEAPTPSAEGTVKIAGAIPHPLFDARFAGGAIKQSGPARIEVQKCEAEQALSIVGQALRQARIGLALLLGVRGAVPDFDVETKLVDFSVPAGLQSATETALLRTAFDRRPDLLGSGYLLRQAEAQIQLVKRQRIPDITLSLGDRKSVV